MVALLIGMFAIIIVADIIYGTKITATIAKLGSNIKPKQRAEYMFTYSVVITHIVLVAVTAVTTVLEPWFAKLLKKINTSVELEDTHIVAIDIVNEE